MTHINNSKILLKVNNLKQKKIPLKKMYNVNSTTLQSRHKFKRCTQTPESYYIQDVFLLTFEKSLVVAPVQMGAHRPVEGRADLNLKTLKVLKS